MLTLSDTTNSTAGRHLVNPCEAESAAAHTASSIPETISTNHAMTNPFESVLSRCGYCSLVREPGCRVPSTDGTSLGAPDSAKVEIRNHLRDAYPLRMRETLNRQRQAARSHQAQLLSNRGHDTQASAALGKQIP